MENRCVKEIRVKFKMNCERMSVQFAQLNEARIPLERIPTAENRQENAVFCDADHKFHLVVRESL